MRDEAPAVGRDRPPLLALHDDEGVVGRGDVVARAQIVGERFGGEDLGQLRGGPLLGEPSAHAGKSSIVGPMDDARPPASPDPSRQGRLSPADAAALLAEGDRLLAAGDFPDAAVRYRPRRRVRRPGGHRRGAARPRRGPLSARRRRRRPGVLEGRPAGRGDAVDVPGLAQHRGRQRPRRRPARRDQRLPPGRPAGAPRGQGRDREPARLADQGDRRRQRGAALLRPRSWRYAGPVS